VTGDACLYMESEKHLLVVVAKIKIFEQRGWKKEKEIVPGSCSLPSLARRTIGNFGEEKKLPHKPGHHKVRLRVPDSGDGAQ